MRQKKFLKEVNRLYLLVSSSDICSFYIISFLSLIRKEKKTTYIGNIFLPHIVLFLTFTFLYFYNLFKGRKEPPVLAGIFLPHIVFFSLSLSLFILLDFFLIFLMEERKPPVLAGILLPHIVLFLTFTVTFQFF